MILTVLFLCFLPLLGRGRPYTELSLPGLFCCWRVDYRIGYHRYLPPRYHMPA